MERLFVDTSAWFAFANRRDPEHEAVDATFRAFQGRLVTSNFIFDEAVTLSLYRLGKKPAQAVGEALLDAREVDLIRLTVDVETNAWRMFCKRAEKHYSFTDCMSFILMKRLGIEIAASLDDDFSAEGFRTVPR